MNKILVYCQTCGDKIHETAKENLTLARELASKTNSQVDAMIAGHKVEHFAPVLAKYGAQSVYVAENPILSKYTTNPFADITAHVILLSKPSVMIFGATDSGRDLAPRVAAMLNCGITADCTRLEIGDYTDPKNSKEYKNILFQIRPNFVGNKLTTIISPDSEPQIVTIREGVTMKKRCREDKHPNLIHIDTASVLKNTDLSVQVAAICVEQEKNCLKDAKIIIAGGFGMGSRENFDLLYTLAHLLKAEVGATRAAIDAGFSNDSSLMIGQTGISVAPQLYIACGVSGQIQHTAGIEHAQTIVSINKDPEAPINSMANHVIIGDVRDIILKFINCLS